jgi:hypothetical protein
MDRCVRATQPPTERPEKASRAAIVTEKARTPGALPPHHDTRRALGYGVAAGAVTAGVLGAVFAVRMRASEKRLAEVNQPGKQWGPEYSSEQQSWEHSRNAMIGSFVASGLLAAGATWLLLGARETTGRNGRSALSLDVGPGRASASASVRF